MARWGVVWAGAAGTSASRNVVRVRSRVFIGASHHHKAHQHRAHRNSRARPNTVCSSSCGLLLIESRRWRDWRFGPVSAALLVFAAGFAGAWRVSGGCGFGCERCRGGRLWFRVGVGVVFPEFFELASLFVLNLGVEDGFGSLDVGGFRLFRLQFSVGLLFRALEAGEDQFEAREAG